MLFCFRTWTATSMFLTTALCHGHTVNIGRHALSFSRHTHTIQWNLSRLFPELPNRTLTLCLVLWCFLSYSAFSLRIHTILQMWSHSYEQFINVLLLFDIWAHYLTVIFKVCEFIFKYLLTILRKHIQEKATNIP